jgi:hypothetical protein
MQATSLPLTAVQPAVLTALKRAKQEHESNPLFSLRRMGNPPTISISAVDSAGF